MQDFKTIIAKVIERIKSAEHIDFYGYGSSGRLPCGLELDRYNGGYKISFKGERIAVQRISKLDVGVKINEQVN